MYITSDWVTYDAQAQANLSLRRSRDLIGFGLTHVIISLLALIRHHILLIHVTVTCIRLTQFINAHHRLLLLLVYFGVHDVEDLVGLVRGDWRCLQMKWTFILVPRYFHVILILERLLRWYGVIIVQCRIDVWHHLLLVEGQRNVRKINESSLLIFIILMLRCHHGLLHPDRIVILI